MALYIKAYVWTLLSRSCILWEWPWEALDFGFMLNGCSKILLKELTRWQEGQVQLAPSVFIVMSYSHLPRVRCSEPHDPRMHAFWSRLARMFWIEWLPEQTCKQPTWECECRNPSRTLNQLRRFSKSLTVPQQQEYSNTSPSIVVCRELWLFWPREKDKKINQNKSRQKLTSPVISWAWSTLYRFDICRGNRRASSGTLRSRRVWLCRFHAGNDRWRICWRGGDRRLFILFVERTIEGDVFEYSCCWGRLVIWKLCSVDWGLGSGCDTHTLR